MSEIAEGRPLTARWGPGEIAIALVGFAWIALAAFWAPAGVYIVDGFVYQAMIDAFALNGSLFVENGFEEYGSQALKLHQLNDVDGRLAPQYPGGWGILAAPAYLAAGVRGVIMLNAVASALTLPLIWLAARALFDDSRLAIQAALFYGLASFAVDYALGFWPHGVTTFLVTAAVAAIAAGWRSSPAAELRGALTAGLVLGLAINIRVDALFAAAPIGVWLIGAGRRPYLAVGLFVAGFVPGLAAAAAINYAKFGIASPISYGGSIGVFARLAPLAVAAGAAALALGIGRVRAVLYRPAGLAAAGLAGLVLLLALPAAREVLLRMAQGFWVWVVDFQAHPAPALGLSEMPDGTSRMYGLAKKALLQSLPYAAAVLVLVPWIWRNPQRNPDRGAVAFCFLFLALGIAPIAFITWHGGMASNMRYFLNIMPVLAILSAAAVREIAALSRGSSLLSSAALLAVGGAALLYAAGQGYPWDFALQHTLPNAVVGAIAVLSVLVLLTRGALCGRLATMLRGLVALGLMTAFILGWLIDVQFTSVVRARNADLAELTADLPANAVVATYTPDTAGLRVNRPPALTAQADHVNMRVDPALRALVIRAHAEGRPVFAQGRYLATQLVGQGAASAMAPRYGIMEKFDLYELAPPGAAGAAPQ